MGKIVVRAGNGIEMDLNLKDFSGPGRVKLALTILKSETPVPEQIEALKKIVESWERPITGKNNSNSSVCDSTGTHTAAQTGCKAPCPVVQLGGGSISRTAIESLREIGVTSLNQVFEQNPSTIRWLRGMGESGAYRLAVEAVELGVIDKFDAMIWLFRSRKTRGLPGFVVWAFKIKEAAERYEESKGVGSAAKFGE